MFFRFTEYAVFLAGVDERDIAFVRFRFLVHKGENAACARQRHDHGIELLRHLGNGLREASGKLQEGRDSPQRQRADAGQGQRAAYDGDQYILDALSDVRFYKTGAVEHPVIGMRMLAYLLAASASSNSSPLSLSNSSLAFSS